MKKLIILLFFISCNKKSNKEELSNNLIEPIKTYINSELNKNSIILDTIKILKIDSLTPKKILYLQYDFTNNQYQKDKKTIELEIEKARLENSLGVYNDKNNKEAAIIHAKKINEKASESLKKLNEIKEKIKNNPDSTSFKFYYVTAIIKGTNPNSIQNEIELPFIITPDFKLKESIMNINQ